jgi:hypothetical protein
MYGRVEIGVLSDLSIGAPSALGVNILARHGGFHLQQIVA